MADPLTVANAASNVAQLASSVSKNETVRKAATQATSKFMGFDLDDEGISSYVKMGLDKPKVMILDGLLQSMNDLQRGRWRIHLTKLPIEDGDKVEEVEGKKKTTIIPKIDRRLQFLEFIVEMIVEDGIPETKRFLITENIIRDNDDLDNAINSVIEKAKNPRELIGAITPPPPSKLSRVIQVIIAIVLIATAIWLSQIT